MVEINGVGLNLGIGFLLTSKQWTKKSHFSRFKQYKTHAPFRDLTVKYAPWLSKSTKVLMSERDAAHEHAAETDDTEEWRLYKSFRNQCTAKERKTKIPGRSRSWTILRTMQ